MEVCAKGWQGYGIDRAGAGGCDTQKFFPANFDPQINFYDFFNRYEVKTAK